MGILTSFWQRLTGRSERKYNSLDLFREIYGGRQSKTGKVVNLQSAFEVTAVLGCARVIAEGISQVPLKLLRQQDRSRTPATEHPLYDVLHRRPNPWQTSFEFRETLALHAVLAGNFYAYKGAGLGDAVRELIPFQPGQVSVKRATDGSLEYEVTAESGSKQVFPQAAIWHVRGPSWNSWMGLDSVVLAREAIGLAIATEESQATLHKQGAMTNGLYSVEGTLTEAQHKSLREWIEREIAGLENAWRPIILDRNAKFTPVAMSGVEAQLLETRRYQVEEICRAFRVMPIMVGYSDKTATYASAEQMFLAHVVHTLAPWYERLEQSIDVNLLSEADRKAGLYAKFIEEGLLRGSLQATADFLVKLTTNGLMTRNEGRDKLDLNPLDGLDVPLTPANMTVGAKPEAEPVDQEMRDAQLANLKREPSTTINVAPAPVTVNHAPSNFTASVAIPEKLDQLHQIPALHEQSLAVDKLAGSVVSIADAVRESLERSAEAHQASLRLAAEVKELARITAAPKEILRDATGKPTGIALKQ